MFGKGVEIWGFVDNIVRDGTRGKTTGREAVGFEYRIKAGVLVVDGGNQCFVNGAPTNVGLVFLRSGAYARSFTCDPERKGTAPEGLEISATYTLRTTASVTGNVVTLNFSMANTFKGSGTSPREGRLEMFARSSTKGMVRIRFDGQTCTVLAVSTEQETVADLRPASGAPYRETEVRLRVPSPTATCSFLGD